MAMVSMKRDPKSSRERENRAAPMETIAPDYPWGLCLDLQAEELDKLGITTLPEVGAEMELTVRCMVTRVAQSASAGPKGNDEHRNVGLQITDIEIEADDNDEDD